jgi:hypothetical protein
MAIHPEPPTDADQRAPNFSPRLRTALGATALILALLPVPVTRFGLLPAYHMHARFLIFYAPLICLLLLGYCLYIRDLLARVVMAGVLYPPPESNPFYPDTFHVRLQRGFAYLRAVLLAVLPIALLGGSFFSTVRYTKVLNQSVTVAALRYVASRPGPEGMGFAPDRASRASPVQGGTPAEERRHPNMAPGDSVAVRALVLNSAGIHEIPRFTELTVLYIGSFVSALGAIVVMWLKEYAKAAMGLSEQDLVLGSARGPFA